jgi:hypothetical protein
LVPSGAGRTMTKIPVGKTIARAYGFAFRDFLRLLGVM